MREQNGIFPRPAEMIDQLDGQLTGGRLAAGRPSGPCGRPPLWKTGERLPRIDEERFRQAKALYGGHETR